MKRSFHVEYRPGYEYYVILARVAGQDVWQREASSETFAFRSDAEDAMYRLEPINDDGARLEYKVVERWS